MIVQVTQTWVYLALSLRLCVACGVLPGENGYRVGLVLHAMQPVQEQRS